MNIKLKKGFLNSSINHFDLFLFMFLGTYLGNVLAEYQQVFDIFEKLTMNDL